MKKIALYAGSFDPVTNGHLDIIKRALQLFDKVVVGIGVNPNKTGTFKPFQRRGFILTTLHEYYATGRLAVEEYKGLTIDYAKMIGAKYIIKGLRTTQDFDYERLINDLSLTQQRDIETVLLFSDQKLGHVSSSAVKELAKHVGLISDMVPPIVRRALENYEGRSIVGVTGTIGSGKTTLCKRLQTTTNAHYLNLDEIAHELREGEGGLCDEVRDKVYLEFGILDKKAIGEAVFGNPERMQRLNDIYREPMMTLLRNKLSSLRGTILLEGALLLEFGWEFLCSSGNLILLTTPNDEEHTARLKKRGYTDEQIEKRKGSQLSFEAKDRLATAALKKGDLTRVIYYDSLRGNADMLAETIRSL
jgi:pantetheine-phosphate adenylyltransferase